MGLIILVPLLMVLDFFGAEITDGYVVGNIEYSSLYKETLNKNITKNNNGYVSLERILYFYLVDDSLSFSEIYEDNLDSDLLQMKPISEVCELSKYKVLDICKDNYFIEGSQINELQLKPFSPPIDFSKSTITSYFMEERYVNDVYGVHNAWDLAAPNQTPVYSVCDGTVKSVSFLSTENTPNQNELGNKVVINCELDETIYEVLYLHLYPSSNKVNVGDKVVKNQEIASVGNTGYSTGPHLHLNAKLNGVDIDIMSLISFVDEEES